MYKAICLLNFVFKSDGFVASSQSQALKCNIYIQCGVVKAQSILFKTTTDDIPELALSWWRHQMETFSTLLALYEGNPPVTRGIPSQRPVTQRFDVFFGLRLNKRLSNQSRRRWFETPSRSLWCHGNVKVRYGVYTIGSNSDLNSASGNAMLGAPSGYIDILYIHTYILYIYIYIYLYIYTLLQRIIRTVRQFSFQISLNFHDRSGFQGISHFNA